MKVELSIADDRELRAAIKDLIKGEVVAIARGEIRTILAEVLKEGVVPKTKEEIDQLIKAEVRAQVQHILSERTEGWSNTVVKDLARQEVATFIRQLALEFKLV
jgi:hypothetical protein